MSVLVKIETNGDVESDSNAEHQDINDNDENYDNDNLIENFQDDINLNHQSVNKKNSKNFCLYYT